LVEVTTATGAPVAALGAAVPAADGAVPAVDPQAATIAAAHSSTVTRGARRPVTVMTPHQPNYCS